MDKNTSMSLQINITLSKIDLPNSKDLYQIHPTPEQEKYSCPGKELIKDIEQPNTAVYGIYKNNTIVGCFCLDFADQKLKSFTRQRYCHLRALTIDKNKQRQGLATGALQALLLNFSSLYPKCQQILLSVNCLNLPAIALYETVGFQKQTELYLGGKAGPQHVYIFSF